MNSPKGAFLGAATVRLGATNACRQGSRQHGGASRRLLCVNHGFAWANFSISAWVRAHRHQHTARRSRITGTLRELSSRAGRCWSLPATRPSRVRKGRPSARAPRRPAAIACRVRDRRRRRVASRDVKGSWCEATFPRNRDEEVPFHRHTGGWLHLVRSWRFKQTRQDDTTQDARGKVS